MFGVEYRPAVRRLPAHQVRDRGAHVAALSDVAGVAETAHQLRPGDGDAPGVPTALGRLAGEPVAGQPAGGARWIAAR